MGISTHILDTAAGRPATGVPVSLEYWTSTDWVLLNRAATDSDGRIGHLLQKDSPFKAGRYRARFDTAAYFELQGLKGFYPYADVVFEVRDTTQHYHVPLLLTANGYTTYRGS